MGAPTLLDGNISVATYRKLKIKMFERDFYISLTEKEKQDLEAIESKFAIDRYCRKILHNRWGR